MCVSEIYVYIYICIGTYLQVHNSSVTPIGEKKRRHRAYYEGFSSANVLRGLKLPTLPEMWTLTFAEKKSCYGSAMHAVGGPTSGVEGNKEKRSDPSIEPFCYHSLPVDFYREIIETDVRPQIVLDWCAGDGQAAAACLANRTSYIGACHTSKHRDALLLGFNVFLSFFCA